MVFPLPLVPGEYYMLDDDRVAYPMDIFCRLRFSGPLDRPRFDAAWRATLARHPLLSAIVAPSNRGQYEWIVAQQTPPPSMRWRDEEPPGAAWATPAIDLRTEAGLRAWADEGSDGATRLVLQFHHACCDGIATMQFIEDLLIIYEAMTGGAASAALLRTLDPKRLLLRDRFHHGVMQQILRLPQGIRGASRTLKRWRHRPLPLTDTTLPNAAAEADATPLPGLCVYRFSREATEHLLEAARRSRCTLNDLLLRDLFLAVARWWASGIRPESEGYIRIAVPLNLRSSADHAMAAANKVSMIFLDRQPQRLDPPEVLLRSVQREMDFVKRWRLGTTLLTVFRHWRRYFGDLKRLLPDNHCLNTIVLSNFGRPLDVAPLPHDAGQIVVGGVILEQLEVFSPVRPLSTGSFAIVTYGGRLTVCLRYHPWHHTPAEGRRLLEAFVQQIDRSVPVDTAT